MNARRAAFSAPLLVLAAVTATHLGGRCGYYSATRPEGGTQVHDTFTADGHLALIGGMPFCADVTYTHASTTLFRGGLTATGIIDDRLYERLELRDPGAPHRHVVLLGLAAGAALLTYLGDVLSDLTGLTRLLLRGVVRDAILIAGIARATFTVAIVRAKRRLGIGDLQPSIFSARVKEREL